MSGLPGRGPSGAAGAGSATETVVRAPGKLYVAGEYAVVEPGFPAVLVAVDRYVTVRVTRAVGPGHITSDLHAGSRLEWHRLEGDMVVEPDEHPFSFVLAAMRIVEEVVAQLGESLQTFDLEITSELADDSGRKFGLGSSAAVTVATVRALCGHYQLDLSRMEQLKLALLAASDVQRSGSGGDVAASMFGGWIAYTAFDRDWARLQRANQPVATLITLDWPGLSVRRLPPPAGLELVVGWTGSPASTSHLVGGVQSRKSGVQLDYPRFLRESRQCVTGLADALADGDASAAQSAIRRNRELLRALGENTGVTIETPLLEHLIETAEQHGGAAKTSGAGGGDCGIVLAGDAADIEGMLADWERAGVQRLDLHAEQPEGQLPAGAAPGMSLSAAPPPAGAAGAASGGLG